jgi:DNA-directed RNA polymerase specialized sigma24 family protein
VSVAQREFATFFEEAEPRLRRALVAAYGPDEGREACAAALAYAWEHWDEVSAMSNATGYLYRVGQSSRKPRKQPPAWLAGVAPATGGDPGPEVEPALLPAMRDLTEHQRASVLLVHGYGWTHEEVATTLDIGVSSVRNHLRRGLDHLRARLGEVATDA